MPSPSRTARHRGPSTRSVPGGRAVWALVAVAAFSVVRAVGIESESRPAHLVGEEDLALLARIQDVIDDWDPRKLRNPYVARVPGVAPDGAPMERSEVRRSDLTEFVADVEAAEALGKAFFWEMQAGSDFRRVGGVFVGTACASCHYRFGADARNTHTTRIPYVVWDRYRLDPGHPLAYGETQRPYDAAVEASRTIASVDDLYLPPVGRDGFPHRPGAGEGVDGEADDGPRTPLSLIVGSQGVPRRLFGGLNAPPTEGADDWQSEEGLIPSLTAAPECGAHGGPGDSHVPEEWEMFSGRIDGARKDMRQVTVRNSPSVVNAGFSDRLFHDGRAESTFNGFSVFGDDDRREPIHVRHDPAEGGPPTFKAVRIAVTHAALASQAVGPIVNEVEMSYEGRRFPDLARKLLDAPVLGFQRSGGDRSPDSVLGRAEALGILRPGSTYRDLIKRAFRREWWDGSLPGGKPASCVHPEDAARVPLVLAHASRDQEGSLLEANFSLFWGLSIMLYEAGLVSNQSPFDSMMQGDAGPVNDRWAREHETFEAVVIDRLRTRHPPPAGTPPFEFTSGAEVFQRGFRVFLSRGCHDCHAGPLFSESSSREANASIVEPIGRTIDSTLLPNSRGDAVALALEREHRRVLARVADLLVGSGAAKPAAARSFALELDLLRDRAGGYPRRLEALVRDRLEALRLPTTGAAGIAGVLSSYERNLASFTGDRIFFTEDQRVAMAKELVDPVLVEKTPFSPLAAGLVRPRLPFAGPPVSAPYAFYDTGFYALGVAPPRYDRGIGEVTSELEPGDGGPQTPANTPRSGKRSALGSAYQFDPSWRRRRPGETPAPGPAPAPTPARHHGTVDDSWVRDVPAWPGDFAPGEHLPEHASRRRSDVHFHSRARRLVLSETTWGHRKPFLHDNELLFWGAFRTPSLRNVELTAPYMHNGRLPTIGDVLEFYDRGGDVPADRTMNPDKHPAMRSLDLDRHDKIAMAFFLACLTDERVRHERAPFDHPELRIVNGVDASGADRIVAIPATGAAGGDTPPSFPAPR